MALANRSHSSSLTLDIEKPVFSDSSINELPLQFIKSLENFCKVNNVEVEQILILVKECLKGSVAEDAITRYSCNKIQFNREEQSIIRANVRKLFNTLNACMIKWAVTMTEKGYNKGHLKKITVSKQR